MKPKLIQTLTIITLLTCQKISASKEHLFFLCDNLPNWEMRARLGITPLHCAQTIEDAQKLVKYGCDINARDNDLLTPIQYMMYHNRREIAVYLFSQGAQFNRKDHVRIDAILDKKNRTQKDLHDYIADKFISYTESYMKKHDKVNSQLFFKGSDISYKILKEFDKNPKSPASITSRHTPTPDIAIPSPYFLN